MSPCASSAWFNGSLRKEARSTRTRMICQREGPLAVRRKTPKCPSPRSSTSRIRQSGESPIGMSAVPPRRYVRAAAPGSSTTIKQSKSESPTLAGNLLPAANTNCRPQAGQGVSRLVPASGVCITNPHGQGARIIQAYSYGKMDAGQLCSIRNGVADNRRSIEPSWAMALARQIPVAAPPDEPTWVQWSQKRSRMAF